MWGMGELYSEVLGCLMWKAYGVLLHRSGFSFKKKKKRKQICACWAVGCQGLCSCSSWGAGSTGWKYNGLKSGSASGAGSRRKSEAPVSGFDVFVL